MKIDIHSQEVAGYTLEKAKELLKHSEGLKFWLQHMVNNLSEEEHSLNPYEMAFVISKHEENFIGCLAEILHILRIKPVKYEEDE